MPRDMLPQPKRHFDDEEMLYEDDDELRYSSLALWVVGVGSFTLGVAVSTGAVLWLG